VVLIAVGGGKFLMPGKTFGPSPCAWLASRPYQRRHLRQVWTALANLYSTGGALSVNVTLDRCPDSSGLRPCLVAPGATAP